MLKLKAADLVNSIAQLGTTKAYEYYTGATKIRITEVVQPEGPIHFVRWNSAASESSGSRSRVTVNQLASVAPVFEGRANYPIHFDRLFSAGGNSRSALETLLALTPHFFICYPQRTNPYTGRSEDSLKHIMWCPDDEHPLGVIKKKPYEQVISEVELGVDFGKIQVTSRMLGKEFATIEAKKIHTQMQVALVEIGNSLGFHTWIARNDHSIPVGSSQLGKLPGVIQALDKAGILYTDESKRAASLMVAFGLAKTLSTSLP